MTHTRFTEMFTMAMWLFARYKIILIPLSVLSSDTKDSLKVVLRREILPRDILQTPPNYHLSLTVAKIEGFKSLIA